jgi:hypothetical protein
MNPIWSPAALMIPVTTSPIAASLSSRGAPPKSYPGSEAPTGSVSNVIHLVPEFAVCWFFVRVQSDDGAPT